MINLTTATVADLDALPDACAADPSLIAHTRIQILSDQFATLDPAVLRVLNKVYAAVPGLGLRLFSAMDHRSPVDITALQALPNLRHLMLHYGVPALKDTAPLAGLVGLESLALEIRAAFDTGFLEKLVALKDLTVIREGQASTRPDFSCAGDLPALARYQCIGYAKGVTALNGAKALKTLHLQQIKVPHWNIFPPTPLHDLTLNAVACAEPIDAGQLGKVAQRVSLVRMDKHLHVPLSKVFGPCRPRPDGTHAIALYMPALETIDDSRSGHDWARMFEPFCKDNVKLDPEAGGLSAYGPKDALSRWRDDIGLELIRRYPG